MAFAAFDLLELDGQSVMGEPWTTRRKRLEDLLETPPPAICLVPVTEDAPVLWDTWVGQGVRVSSSRSGPRCIGPVSARPPARGLNRLFPVREDGSRVPIRAGRIVESRH
jgi:hypothetical protein